MEESGLLKERLHAITEKHRIQEDIRQKKQELDQEKLKLQHLKKKSLREQWLLQDSTSLLSDQQQTRALQLNIHRIEMEIESLERQESMISTNESFILNRLKAVEKSPEEIIKEAQDSFISKPSQVTIVVPDIQKPLSPPAKEHTEPNTPRKTLFAMEINVTKNLLTGESTVLSTASVPPEELSQHTGLKVYDDGRKCVYALNSQQGSHDQSRVSELSANEVEQLLKSATEHRQVNQQNYHQNHSRRGGHCFFSHQDERERGEGLDPRNQGGHYGNHLLRNNIVQKDFSCRENWQRKPLDEHRYGHQESHYIRQEERNNQSNLRDGHRLGNQVGYHSGPQKDRPYSSYQTRSCYSIQEAQHNHATNSIIRSSSSLNGGRANGCPPPRSHDHEVVSTYQPQLCYTPANYIPLTDYVSVDEEELYCYSPPSNHSHSHNADNQSTALCSDPTHSDRVPSPLYRDDTPYTILSTMETSEPITAIFMGFQTAEDDSGQVQGFEGSLKAELVIIEDNEENADNNSMTEKKNHSQRNVHGYATGSSAYGNMGRMEGVGDRWTERRMGPGIKKIRKKHKPCCTLS
ncbi:palmdelphin-like [Thunnus maccoyii]|uniref:palmdelphin-like n=1 Tax=Thunnus maccoyii TaxID=8240 RepID=UPI001C4C095B|nr:palmdelphin-like [Thunnus maccoyii]XP_042285006.1 palmdelphin-like [Thunnus maccoyii]